VNEEKKSPYILHRDVEKATKKINDNKARGDYYVPGDALKLLGENGSKIITQLINNIYETGERPKDVTEVTMIALKKPKATKRSDHLTVSRVTHTYLRRYLEGGLKGKLRLYLQKISLV
jgi:hypothetical protein